MIMIDIHSHIAFGLDDGAKNIEESIQMAKLAVKEGITKIVATPHHWAPYYEPNTTSIEERVILLNETLIERNIPLEVYVGQEIRISDDILPKLDRNEYVTINHSKYILIEFPPNGIPLHTDRLFFDLMLNGFTPIIAHPERNAAIVEKPDRLYRLIKNGALSQVTSGSIAGKFGKKIQKLSLQFIEYGLANIVASDAHNCKERPFLWKESFTILDQKLGTNTSAKLNRNALNILTNQVIEAIVPERLPQKEVFGLF